MRSLLRGALLLLWLAVPGCGGPPPAVVPDTPNPAPRSAAAKPVRTIPPRPTSRAPITASQSAARPVRTITSRPTSRAPLTASPSAAPPCAPQHGAGTVVLALPRGRRALLAVPTGRDRHHLLPLVVALPGYGRTSEELAVQSRMPARATAAGALAVLPQGAGPARSWNFSGTTGYDDLGFLSALVANLVATECADRAHIVISGISDGGDMAAYAACALPGTFRAVITVAASTDPRAGCHRTRVIAVHGDTDPLDPYGGGPDGRPGYPAIPPATEAIAAWAALDGCRTPATLMVSPHVATTTYPCGAQLVTIRGGGHTWPGGTPSPPTLGVTTGEYDATGSILGLT